MAGVISTLGDGIAAIALPLFLATLTGNSRLVTGLYAAELVSWPLFGGRVARWVDGLRNPGRVMVQVDGARTVALAGVTAATLAGWTHPILLYLCAFLVGLGFVAHSAAASSLLPHLATGDRLTRYNSLLFLTEAIGVGLAGPALGGFAFGFAHWVPFALDAVSFAGSAVLLRPYWSLDRPIHTGADSSSGPRIVLRHGLLRPLFAMAVVLAVSQAIVLSSLVLFARDVLGLTSRAFGVFMAVTAIGNVAGAFVTPRLWRAHRRTGELLFLAVLAWAAGYVVLSQTRSVVTACAALVVEAFAVGISSTISPTLRLEHAGGRPAAVATFFRQGIFVAHAGGGIAAGFLVAGSDYSRTYALAGIIALAAGVFVVPVARRVTVGVPGPAEHDPIATNLGLVDVPAGHTTELPWADPQTPDRAGW